MLPKTAKMPAIRDSHVVKIAVEFETGIPQLIEFDQRQPLATIIQNLCSFWVIQDPESYALRFTDVNNNYVTEKNRHDVKNGSVLKMVHSPSKTASVILEKLLGGKNEEMVKVLQELPGLSADITFALEFIKEQGLNLIIGIIEDPSWKDGGNILKYALSSFVELMDHGTVSWDILQPAFISRNIAFINGNSNKDIVQSALSILENIVQTSSKFPLVEKEVTLEVLLKLLQDSPSTVIQQNTIALINALFIKADDTKRKAIAATFSSKQYRSIINSVITTNMGAEISHQLYVLQTLTLGLLEQRMKTPIDTQDQEAQDKVKELRRIAFEADGIEPMPDVTARRQHGGSYSTHYKKLGFKCDINPSQDFLETPPGVLALDCMVYFARNYTQNYTKVVHENSCRADEHECPFGRTSIELVKVLCDILRIGETPSEHGQEFHPMFFTHDHPFEEFFCICIVVLNKTWKDMRATTEDFVKVFSVVREQITRSITGRPASLEDFKAKIHSFTYNTITTLRQQERTSREECESTASAIVSLKEKITPEIMSLIKEQRLGYLVVGTRFSKYSGGKRERDKYWYARLSPNHKVIHYGDCDEKTVPTLEELNNKLPVIDIRQILIGKECPHMKEMRAKKSTFPLGFSLVTESSDQQTLDFVAPDEATFNYWTDGINALLCQPMVSKQKDDDFETLLSMEIKLRLLDTEGVDISKDPPAIPPEPENYDFCFDS